MKLANLVVLFSMILGIQAVRITHHPQDQNVSVGGVARFQCGYNESRSFPDWFINNRVYTVQGLPSSRYSFYDQTLTLRDVQVSDNLSTYQCVVDNVRSEQATLFVMPLDVSEKATTSVVMTTSPTTAAVNSTAKYHKKTTTTSATTNKLTEDQVMTSSHGTGDGVTREKNFDIIVPVIGSGSAIVASLVIASIVLAIVLIAMKLYRRRNEINREYEEVNDIKIQPNFSQFKLENNPSYECRFKTEENTKRNERADLDTPIYAEIEDKLNLTPNDAYHIVLHQILFDQDLLGTKQL